MFELRRPLAVLALLAWSGCAATPDPIPRYDYADARTARAILHARLAKLHTVRGEATIVLTDPRGQTVRLDAAYALEPPAKARLRAWKFGQAVFDLTLHDGDAWAYLPRDEARPIAPGLREALGRWLGLLADNELFHNPLEFEDGRTLTVSGRQPDGTRIECTIDRATVTPRLYRLYDDKGFERFTLTLSDYRSYADEQVWPTTIVARGEQGTFEVRATGVEINTVLDAATFTPPARAEKLP